MDAEIFDLDKALDALGWRQTDLAARLGIWPETVSRWHTGEVPKYARAYLQEMLKLKRIRDYLDKQLVA